MRLGMAGEYAVRCVLYLSTSKFGRIVPRKEIANAMDIPSQFLGKVAQYLAKAGLIEIVQGAKGGYRLIKKPKDISLLEVVEAVKGELFLNDCILRPDNCARVSSCAVHRVWQKARYQLRNTLKKVNFQNLIEQELCMEVETPDGSLYKKD